MAASSSAAQEIRQFFFARVFMLKTGQTLYAMAEAKPYNEGIDLVYKTRAEPFEEMIGGRRWYDEVPIQEDAHPSAFSADGSSGSTGTEQDRLRFVEENKRVKRVFINLHISHFPKNDSIEANLIKTISHLARLCFPNLDPRQSIFITHAPLFSYIAKDLLHPEPLDTLNLILR